MWLLYLECGRLRPNDGRFKDVIREGRCACRGAFEGATTEQMEVFGDLIRTG